MNQAAIIETSGLAQTLLEENGSFIPHSTWFGITTSEKTYPDDKVIRYAKTITPITRHMYVLIADHVQIYNKIPFSSKGWKLIRSDEYRKSALKRKAILEEKLRAIPNISISLMDAECIEDIHQGDRKKQFNLNYTWQLFGHTRLYSPDSNEGGSEKQFRNWVRKASDDKIPLTEASVILGLGEGKQISPFERDIMQITEYQARHLVERLPKNSNVNEALKCLSFYTQYQLFLTYLLAKENIAPIKIGPLAEKKYDEMVLKLINGKYGKSLENPSIQFGGVYLE